MFLRHIQRSLDIQLPLLRGDPAEFLDEYAPQRRLSPSESDSSACCLKIKIIYLHAHQKLLRSHHPEGRALAPGLGIEAPAAAQRTGMKDHQGRDSFPVNAYPMPGYGRYGALF